MGSDRPAQTQTKKVFRGFPSFPEGKNEEKKEEHERLLHP